MEIDQKKIEHMLCGIHPVNKLHIYKAIVNSYPERFCKYMDRLAVVPCSIISTEIQTDVICGYKVIVWRHIPCNNLYDLFYSIKLIKNETD